VLTRDGAEIARWPLIYPACPDLAVVHRLARAHLEAKRAGLRIDIVGAGDELLELLDLTGLRPVLGLRQVLGHPEGGEEVGVEEVVVGDDPIA
jgi:hypothetical protein